MAINIFADNPQSLLDAIYQGVDDGSIVTWSYDNDGDFTHVTASKQWQEQAWLRPTVQPGCLMFYILGERDTQMSREIYAVYHGRFVEMLLVHFDQEFTEATASALATADDYVGVGS